MTPKTPLIYVLYSGDLYGTERMALATLPGLSRAFDPLILAPPGRAVDEARRRGFRATAFDGYVELVRRFAEVLASSPRVAMLATRCEQSLLFWLVNLRYRRRCAHFVVMHGGGGKNVYRRNRVLLPLPVDFIAVSPFVRDCLEANGVPARRTTVIHNFLAQDQLAAVGRRTPFTAPGVRRVALVTRLVGVKRVDLLFAALDIEPRLAAMAFDIYGDGEQHELLAQRAAAHPNVRLCGFDPAVVTKLGEYDLLLHTAPREPFGLVILEAMTAGIPALVASTGGPAAIVEDGMSGYHFRADDARSLASRLMTLSQVMPEELDRIVRRARERLSSVYVEEAACAAYRELLQARLGTQTR